MKIKILALSIALGFLGFSIAPITSNSASAADKSQKQAQAKKKKPKKPAASSTDSELKNGVCGGASLSLSSSDNCSSDETKNSTAQSFTSLIARIVEVLSVIVGIIAVIMVILGGFKFITSGGDSGNVASARNTIIYALIGLVIVALAQIIVRFVLTKTPG